MSLVEFIDTPKLTQVDLYAAEYLKNIRQTKRFSLRSLSAALSTLDGSPAIGPNAISQIENGKRRMTISEAWAFSQLLEVSPLSFFPPAQEMYGDPILPLNQITQDAISDLVEKVVRVLHDAGCDAEAEAPLLLDDLMNVVGKSLIRSSAASSALRFLQMRRE